jgi:hypothetical protein
LVNDSRPRPGSARRVRGSQSRRKRVRATSAARPVISASSCGAALAISLRPSSTTMPQR